jgi:hypothetical protein
MTNEVNEMSAASRGSGANYSAFPNSWIPVTERLPEDGQPSLACWGQRSTRMGIAMIRRSDGKAAWFHKYDIDDDDWGIAMEAPSHWMPLPAPPSDGR